MTTILRAGLERLWRGVPAGFFRNVAWQYGASLWAGISTFIYGLVLGKYLGAGEYGLMAMAMAFAQIFSQALELRLQEAVVKYVSEFWESDERAKAIATVKLSLLVNVCSTGLAFGLVFAVWPLAQPQLREDPRAFTIMILGALTVLSNNFAQATCQSLLRVLGNFRVQAFITMVANTLKLFLTLALLLWLQIGLLGVMLVALGASLLSNVAIAQATFNELKRNVTQAELRAPIGLIRPYFREMAIFVRSTYLLSLSMIPTRDLDVNLLGYFVSKESIGIYRMAKNFMAAVWILSDAAFLAVYPELARLWSRRELGKIRGFVKRLAVMMGAFGLALYVGGCVAVPVVVHYILGPSYQGTGVLFALMAWGLLFWAPTIWANPLLMAAGRPDLVLRASVLASLLMLCANLYAIPRWGAAGSAFVFALSNPVVAALVLFYGRSSGVFNFKPEPGEGSRHAHGSE